MFTDESVHIAGPIRPGPSLHEWAHGIDDATLAGAGPAEPDRGDSRPRRHDLPDPAGAVRTSTGSMPRPRRCRQRSRSSSTRRWPSTCRPPRRRAGRRARRALSCCSSTSPCSPSGTFDAGPGPAETALTAFACAGLTYLPAGHTAEQDLSAPPAGGHHHARLRAGVHRPVDPRHRGAWRPVRRRPGRHAVLRAERSRTGHPRRLTSRRAVPIRKLDYRLQGHCPRCRFLDDGGRAHARPRRPASISAATCCRSSSRRSAGPGTTSCSSLTRRARRCRGTPRDAVRRAQRPRQAIDRFVAETVPDPADRFDLEALDRPLAGRRFESAEDLHRHVARHVADDVARRTDPSYSADLGAPMAMLLSSAPSDGSAPQVA